MNRLRELVKEWRDRANNRIKGDGTNSPTNKTQIRAALELSLAAELESALADMHPQPAPDDMPEAVKQQAIKEAGNGKRHASIEAMMEDIKTRPEPEGKTPLEEWREQPAPDAKKDESDPLYVEWLENSTDMEDAKTVAKVFAAKWKAGRELAEAKWLVDAYKETKSKQVQIINDLKQQRDEARREATIWRDHWKGGHTMSMVVYKKLPWENENEERTPTR
jgi:hypothetical protein